jgi:hypothetical protein
MTPELLSSGTSLRLENYDISFVKIIGGCGDLSIANASRNMVWLYYNIME